MKESGKFLFLDTAGSEVIAGGELSAPADAAEACATLMRLLGDAGYDPVTQLASYLIADDPTYLPEETEARAIARRVGRDKLLVFLLTFYMEHADHAD